jgi:hypothetical protein
MTIRTSVSITVRSSVGRSFPDHAMVQSMGLKAMEAVASHDMSPSSHHTPAPSLTRRHTTCCNHHATSHTTRPFIDMIVHCSVGRTFPDHAMVQSMGLKAMEAMASYNMSPAGGAVAAGIHECLLEVLERRLGDPATEVRV